MLTKLHLYRQMPSDGQHFGRCMMSAAIFCVGQRTGPTRLCLHAESANARQHRLRGVKEKDDPDIWGYNRNR